MHQQDCKRDDSLLTTLKVLTEKLDEHREVVIKLEQAVAGQIEARREATVRLEKVSDRHHNEFDSLRSKITDLDKQFVALRERFLFSLAIAGAILTAIGYSLLQRWH